MAGVQLAHAGRKASTWRPWLGKHGSVPIAAGGWTPVGPSAIAFSPEHAVPTALDDAGIAAVVQAFVEAAERSLAAGFKIAEVHAAHGYLLHQFLSPLSNQRQDRYGGSFDNRIRLLLEVTAAVRQVWPEELPLFVRLSATDWVDDGWNADETVELARRLKDVGVDLIDVSSGGTAANADIPVGPGYQTQFAERVRKEAGIATGTVGMITEAVQAEHILRTGQADLILLARELLRDPYWPLHAAEYLRDGSWPGRRSTYVPPIATRRSARCPSRSTSNPLRPSCGENPMKTSGLLDQLLKSGQDLLQKQQSGMGGKPGGGV